MSNVSKPIAELATETIVAVLSPCIFSALAEDRPEQANDWFDVLCPGNAARDMVPELCRRIDVPISGSDRYSDWDALLSRCRRSGLSCLGDFRLMGMTHDLASQLVGNQLGHLDIDEPGRRRYIIAGVAYLFAWEKSYPHAPDGSESWQPVGSPCYLALPLNLRPEQVGPGKAVTS